MTQRQHLEIQLEEIGEHSWLTSLLNTLGGSHGSAQYRFVARPPGPTHGPDDHVLEGSPFPALRAQDLDDRSRPHAWLELAEKSWEELDHRLVADGWTPETGSGAHWWSRAYTRLSG